MESRNEPGDQDEIRRLVKQISEAWLEGDTSRLNQYFHDRMTITGPDLSKLGTTRAACVKSYEDFIQQTTILKYEDTEPEITLYGDTAVAVSPWTITYEMKAQRHTEAGRDLLVLVRHHDSWLVVWRTVVPQPESM